MDVTPGTREIYKLYVLEYIYASLPKGIHNGASVVAGLSPKNGTTGIYEDELDS